MSGTSDGETSLVSDKTEAGLLADGHIQFRRIVEVKTDLDERSQGILHLPSLLKRQHRNQAFWFEKLVGLVRLP